MGLFSKKAKVIPSISVNGIKVFYNPDHESWDFQYRGQYFVAYRPNLDMPSREDLDEILKDIADLTPEMTKRISDGWRKGGGTAKTDDGESYFIDLDEFGEKQSFRVMWSGGVSWGDMGIDFAIQERRIVDEAWGD